MKCDKYNEQRKKLLEKLDRGENVSIIELGMYDLTPYFKDEFDVSLSEAILLNKNVERRIEHVKRDIYFSPPQDKALKTLYENERVILSAPTSFGKTLLIKEYIYKKKPQNIVYIVPTNALAYELERSFKENASFSNYVIFDKCSKIVDSNSISRDNLFFIGTQEKFLEIDKDMIGDVDLFVIDEAYKLHESIKRQRAYKLSETFLDSMTRNSKRIFLLTPNAKFSGFEKYKFDLFESTFNAVEKNYIVLDGNNFYNTLLKKGQEEKTILFCGSPNQINITYEKIKNAIEMKDKTDFVKQLEADIHPDWSVIKLLQAGILTHHGQMPKYVQNRMINMFNESKEYNVLFGTNSISEGINTVTKNLFIHPEYNKYSDILLLKNTIGRAGRLGEYPIGYIYSTVKINDKVNSEIEISLAISDEEELAEIEDSKNIEKIKVFCEGYDITLTLCQELLINNKISLARLGKILDALKKDCRYPGVSNFPFIASSAYGREYNGIMDNDKIIINGYLNSFYLDGNQRIFLDNFSDRITYFKKKRFNEREFSNTEVINNYMQFIYSTLEYYIMPIVNIGLELRGFNENWSFGRNVIKSLEDCKRKYYRKTYGNLDVDNLSENHMRIIGTMKDYGMTNIIKLLDKYKLDEIERRLNARYSTIDILKVIEYLAINSEKHKSFFMEIKKKFIL